MLVNHSLSVYKNSKIVQLQRLIHVEECYLTGSCSMVSPAKLPRL